MHLVLLNSKYTLNKKKIISDDLANNSNECDSLMSLESLCEDTFVKPKENHSHLEFARPDPDNLSLLSTRTTLKVKSPAGFAAAFKRPAFEFEEGLSAKQNPADISSHSQKPQLIPLSGLKNIFCCFR